VTASTSTSQSQRKAQTRRRLLDAAAKVFAAKGYRGAAIDDVAEVAGYTKGAVYAHFRTKEALYLALIREQDLTSLAEAEALFAAEPDPDKRLAVMDERTATQLRDRDLLMLGYEMVSHAARDPKLRRELRQRAEKARQVNAELVRRQWQDRHIEPAISAEDFDRLMDGLGRHLTAEALLDPKADLVPVARRLMAFLVRAARESASWDRAPI
jgi:AcrR family transcriptional regulator